MAAIADEREFGERRSSLRTLAATLYDLGGVLHERRRATWVTGNW